MEAHRISELQERARGGEDHLHSRAVELSLQSRNRRRKPDLTERVERAETSILAPIGDSPLQERPASIRCRLRREQSGERCEKIGRIGAPGGSRNVTMVSASLSVSFRRMVCAEPPLTAGSSASGGSTERSGRRRR